MSARTSPNSWDIRLRKTVIRIDITLRGRQDGPVQPSSLESTLLDLGVLIGLVAAILIGIRALRNRR
jgi:hypothetical protein